MKIHRYKIKPNRGYIMNSFCTGYFHLNDKDRQLHRIFGRIYQKAKHPIVSDTKKTTQDQEE